MSQIDMWQYEDRAVLNGYQMICGVDEAGRGPLAGPVCAAAVILPPHIEIPGLNDSKKLTDKKRRELFPIICREALAYGIAFADEKEIDSINILQATFQAMKRSVEMPTSGSSNLGHKMPGVSNKSKLLSTVTHCLPRVTPGRFSAFAPFLPEI